jgi:hypothetical protein
VTPYRRSRVFSASWHFGFFAVALGEAVAGWSGAVFLFAAFFLSYELWLSWRGNKGFPGVNSEALIDLPEDAVVESTIATGVRTLLYCVLLAAGVVVGVFYPAIAGATAGFALGGLLWMGLGWYRVVRAEKEGAYRLFYSTTRRRFRVINSGVTPSTWYRGPLARATAPTVTPSGS